MESLAAAGVKEAFMLLKATDNENWTDQNLSLPCSTEIAILIDLLHLRRQPH